MRLNILIGGRAGQGVNRVSEIVSKILVDKGYFVFNYRDYPSLIRGGHNFNILSISDEEIYSFESKLDGVIALDTKTLGIHKKSLKKDGFTLSRNDFPGMGINLNIALAGALTKILGVEKRILLNEVKKKFNNDASIGAAKQGFDKFERRYSLGKKESARKNRTILMSGSEGIAKGFLDSKADLYIAYPMTPATPVMHLLAKEQVRNKLLVFQPENELAVINSAIGASFTGAKVMVGTSGGGYDLMTESLSMQGVAEVPLVVYLASRPGPGTGVPTYSTQADLDIALRGGHGEFPRIVIAPGTAEQARRVTNEAFYLSQKFNALSIILSDKHMAESEYSFVQKKEKVLLVPSTKDLPWKKVLRVNSYEHDGYGNTTEDPSIVEKAANGRLKKYAKIKREVKKLEMVKLYGNKKSKNLVLGWGSSTGAIIDAIEGLDVKFLQVVYMKPLSDKIKEEMSKSEKVLLVEANVTGQLGRLVREKTGIKIDKKILKYDGRPFEKDKLKEEIARWIKN
ncbi:hypothetical protein B6U91_02410 [Candidatus Pacearchaeota archaeon ex4484_71]|nr:MAG: hypothetical protein B6U91_02410 [Candidatus Pacearchaeota archaeon ex4484_71]